MKIKESQLRQIIKEAIREYSKNILCEGRISQTTTTSFTPIDDGDVYDMVMNLENNGMLTPELDELCSADYTVYATRTLYSKHDTYMQPGYEEVEDGPNIDKNNEAEIQSVIQKISQINPELGKAVENAYEKFIYSINDNSEWENELDDREYDRDYDF